MQVFAVDATIFDYPILRDNGLETTQSLVICAEDNSYQMPDTDKWLIPLEEPCYWGSCRHSSAGRLKCPVLNNQNIDKYCIICLNNALH